MSCAQVHQATAENYGIGVINCEHAAVGGIELCCLLCFIIVCTVVIITFIVHTRKNISQFQQLN